MTVYLGAPVAFDRAMIQEHIALGQRVEAYKIEAFVDGTWKTITEGTTIGHKRLDRFDAATATQVRLTIAKSKACPLIRAFGVYKAP